MNEIIIKFKTVLKHEQTQRKEFLTQAEYELLVLEKLNNDDKNVTDYIDIDDGNILDKLEIFRTFAISYTIKETLKKELTKEKKKINIENIFKRKEEDRITDQTFADTIVNFKKFIDVGKNLYSETQNIINAFENDKIKDPINNLDVLIDHIRAAYLTTEESSIILGMTIWFNSQYAKKNKNHQILNIDLIDILSNYYNKDGSFKYNEDCETFKNTLRLLLQQSIDENKLTLDRLILPGRFDLDELVNLLKESNQNIRNNSRNNKTSIPTPEEHTISSETKEALQELRKYYRNGSIIKLPENLDRFYKILEKSGLDKFETKYIKELINNELEKQNKQTGLLTKEEQAIYEKSLELLNSLDYSNNDIYELKELIKELQTIIELLKSSADEEDKQFILSGLPNIITKLSLICSKYEKQEVKESTNRFIFLLDKDNIPYICKDIDSLDPSYKKLVNTLIEKINKNNQQQFKKVLSSEKLPYNLVSMYSPKAYVAFVEICPDKYILMGANVARSGYKEIINRLLSNQEAIKEIENIIKDIEKRNSILTQHEEYLPLLTETNSSKLTRKKVKNN